MKSDGEFKEFYETYLIEKLRPIEDRRIEGQAKSNKMHRYTFISVIFFTIAVGLLLHYEIVYLILFTGVIISLYFAALASDLESKTFKIMRKDFKRIVIPEILKFLFTSFEYIPNQKIAKSVFEKSLLFPSEIETVQGEDFMRFWFENVDIMFCEAYVSGYVPKSQMFHGIFVSASFNKTFSAQTFIFTKKNTSFLRKLRFKIMGAHYNVKLEDPEFEKEFIVLGSDQIESRYILTPGLMQRILEYKRKLNCEMSFSFVKNRLYCAIPNLKDLFEPRLTQAITDYDFIRESYDPIVLYTSLVEDLNLNLRIWSKE